MDADNKDIKKYLYDAYKRIFGFLFITGTTIFFAINLPEYNVKYIIFFVILALLLFLYSSKYTVVHGYYTMIVALGLVFAIPYISNKFFSYDIIGDKNLRNFYTMWVPALAQIPCIIDDFFKVFKIKNKKSLK